MILSGTTTMVTIMANRIHPYKRMKAAQQLLTGKTRLPGFKDKAGVKEHQNSENFDMFTVVGSQFRSCSSLRACCAGWQL